MSADESRRAASRPKQIEKVDLPPGPARDLRDALYDLYLRAGTRTLDDLVALIAADDELPGAPGRDVISNIISGRSIGAQQEDVESVATALARLDNPRDRHPAAKRIVDLWVAAKGAPTVPAVARLGRPVDECDPFILEVHRAIDVPRPREQPLPVLPTYVRRAHDDRIRQVVDEVAGGGSRLVTLVGGSSTGKTRACWEAIHRLAEGDRRWWLWHPKDPSRPGAAAAAIGEAGPFTVVWLNEAQHYLLPADPTLGERIAAGLRSLLEDPGRGPVLVLATLWPEYWNTLATRPTPGAPDPYAQARELLDGTDVRVPDAFTSAELRDMQETGGDDPRLRQAAKDADAGRVTQYLAGVPQLLSRYRNAPPPARAIIDVAIDARRLGHPVAIPHALLDQAAPGYLTDHEWEQAGDDWLEQALAYTATPCKGVPGPLTRIRPRPGDPPSADGQPTYRLADYLEQTGRTERAGVFPPASFWNAAAATISDSDVLRTLAEAAEDRGRYRRAARLYQQAADRGNTNAMWALARTREKAGHHSGAETLYRQAANQGDTNAMWALAQMREKAGDQAGAETLAVQAANQGDTNALRTLAQMREKAGNQTGAETLAIQAANQGDSIALLALAWMREEAGNHSGAETLYRQAANQGDTTAMWMLAQMREKTGDHSGAETLYRQAANQGDTDALLALARISEKAGDQTGAETLAIQAANQGDSIALLALAWMREMAGDQTGAETLYRQAANQGDTNALRTLAVMREKAGDQTGAETLYRQAADQGDTNALLALARISEKAGDQTGAETLAIQAANQGDTSALLTLGQMREKAGDQTGAETLYRQAANQGDTNAMSLLAGIWEEAGDQTSVETLAIQAANQGNTIAMSLLARMRERAGDNVGAERLRRFGLTDDGAIADSFD